MKINDLFKDVFNTGNITNCLPVSGYLIFIFFIYYSSFLNFTLTESIDEEHFIYIVCFTVFNLLYIGLILYLCKKKYRKTAYLISYLPIVSIILLSMYLFYEGIYEIKGVLKQIKQNNSNNQAQS